MSNLVIEVEIHIKDDVGLDQIIPSIRLNFRTLTPTCSQTSMIQTTYSCQFNSVGRSCNATRQSTMHPSTIFSVTRTDYYYPATTLWHLLSNHSSAYLIATFLVECARCRMLEWGGLYTYRLCFRSY